MKLFSGDFYHCSWPRRGLSSQSSLLLLRTTLRTLSDNYRPGCKMLLNSSGYRQTAHCVCINRANTRASGPISLVDECLRRRHHQMQFRAVGADLQNGAIT
ncbi:hypothetical protein TSAR_006120 [Trichomalopsis sarcophagae]|uniref:Uncharacterized protein n=1 Tax=Trichomalopsis sarcophagae TaxID=543379 RepID=A0A232EYE8_9HYME|nr:hypothetical protein TSAR_006120 [Trichomalopsis sarcophagae]